MTWPCSMPSVRKSITPFSVWGMPSWACRPPLSVPRWRSVIDLFRDTMADIKAVGGFDRELELTLLYRGKRFYYLPETFDLMRRYRTPVISPVSAAAGCRHNGTTARLSPSFCGRRLLRVTGTSATSFSSSFPFLACCWWASRSSSPCCSRFIAGHGG